MFYGGPNHRRTKSSWALPGGANRHYDKILRPPSAAHLTGYQALKQENPGYFANQKNQLLSGAETQDYWHRNDNKTNRLNTGKKSLFHQHHQMLNQQQQRSSMPQPTVSQNTARSTNQGSRLSSYGRANASNQGVNLYLQARENRSKQLSSAHESVAQSMQFQDLKVSALKFNPLEHPNSQTRTNQARPSSSKKKVMASTQSQATGNGNLLASNAPAINYTQQQNQTTFYKLDDQRGDRINRDLGKEMHDYLIVPTATMATSTAEIKRFSELGISAQQSTDQQQQNIFGNSMSNFANASSGVPLSIQQRRANSSYGRGKIGHQPQTAKTSTQQDFDYYKKVLGLDQPRPSVFNASNKSSIDDSTSAALITGGFFGSQKQSADSKSKQSGSIQPYVREVQIKKADVVLNMVAEHKDSTAWTNPAASETSNKTPVRTALLKHASSGEYHMRSLGSGQDPTHPTIDALKSLDNKSIAGNQQTGESQIAVDPEVEKVNKSMKKNSVMTVPGKVENKSSETASGAHRAALKDSNEEALTSTPSPDFTRGLSQDLIVRGSNVHGSEGSEHGIGAIYGSASQANLAAVRKQKQMIRVTQRRQNSQQMINLKPSQTDPTDWPSQTSVLMRDKISEEATELLLADQSRNSRIAQSNGAGGGGISASNNAPELSQNTDSSAAINVPVNQNNVAQQAQLTSNSATLITQNMMLEKKEQAKSKTHSVNVIKQGLVSIVQTQGNGAAETVFRKPQPTRQRKSSGSFEAIEEVAHIRQSTSNKNLREMPINKPLAEASEGSNSSEYNEGPSGRSNFPHDAKYKGTDLQMLTTEELMIKKAQLELEKDIRNNAEIHGKTPIRHAPQNVFRANESPILDKTIKRRSTVAEMRSSFTVRMSAAEAQSGHIEITSYGLYEEGSPQKAEDNKHQSITQKKQSSIVEQELISLNSKSIITQQNHESTQQNQDIDMKNEADDGQMLESRFKTFSISNRLDQEMRYQKTPIDSSQTNNTAIKPSVRLEAAYSSATDRKYIASNQASAQSFSNQRIRNKFVASKGANLQTYPRQLEKIAQMSEYFNSAAAIQNKSDRRPNSVAGASGRQARKLKNARNSLSQVEQQIVDYLKCDMELSAFFHNQVLHSVPSTGRAHTTLQNGNKDIKTPFLGTPAGGTPGFNNSQTLSEDAYMHQLGKKHDAKIFDAELEDPREEIKLFNALKKAQAAKNEEEETARAWAPLRENIYGISEPDRMERILQFQKYMIENGLNADKNVLDMQMLALKRSGQLKKPLGFTLQKELREIEIAKHEQSIEKLGNQQHQFKQFMYNHHSDEYYMRAHDMNDLEGEYDLATVQGRRRAEQYEALKEKSFKMFETKHKEMVMENHNFGHVYQPMLQFKNQKQGRDSSNSKNNLNVKIQMPIDEADYNEKELDAMNEQDEHCCTFEKIVRGDYLDRLTKRQKDLGLRSSMTQAEKKIADKMTSNAYDCINKTPGARQPLEQNLIMSIIHKIFKKVDHRVAKRFNVLANLINKIQTITLEKGDIIIEPNESIDKIYVMYSGQVVQTFQNLNRESQLLMAEDIIALWYIKERQYPRSASIEAKVVSEKAQLFTIDLKEIDETLDMCEKNQLSTFVAIVRFYMARDPISLANFGTRDGQLKLDFSLADITGTSPRSPGNRNSSISALSVTTNQGQQPAAQQVAGQGPSGAGRRLNKLKKVNQVYETHFRVTPFFTRDFFPLINQLEIKTFMEGELIFDFNSVPTHFYVIKQGRIRFDDYRVFKQEKDKNNKKDPQAKESHMTKVEGEWFGFESFVCGSYATMTQEQLLEITLQRGANAVGNGFRATAIERCEVVVGSLDTMFNYLTMSDLARLHQKFMQGLYASHPMYSIMTLTPSSQRSAADE